VHEVAPVLADERRRLIAEQLKEEGSVSVTALGRRFGISLMTARRDLAALERQGVARRTHGGAVLPGPSSHEDAFVRRVETAVEAKERLAAAAVTLIAPGEAVFVDSSSTSWYAARRLVRDNLRCTLLTNSVPVMELVCAAGAPQVELIGLCGALRSLTRSLVGPQAVHGVQSLFADKALLSVKGVTEDGQLTDPDPLEAEVKRAMIRQARTPLLLVDGSKFGRPALHVIGPVTDVGRVLAADAPPRALSALGRLGVAVDRA
jgi:DeoR/GlpR family transcriptional regulator of sugar metabolism